MVSTRVCAGVLLTASALAVVSAAPRYSQWSTPQAVAEVNSGELDFPGSISRDGRTLYFQRSPLLAVGEDIWVAHRERDGGAWGPPVRLSDAVNSPFNDRGPTISPDGHWLFFGSDRPGGMGGMDIWASWRAHVHDDAGWTPAVNLGAPVNTAAFDSGPAFLQQASGVTQLYLTSGRPGGPGATDIYVSSWNADGTFTTPVLVPELNTTARDERPYVRHDGLELFLQSNRLGGQFDVWVSTRPTSADPWSAPAPVGGINTTFQETTPVISWDRETLFFGSNRGDAADIFTATRTKLRGR